MSEFFKPPPPPPPPPGPQSFLREAPQQDWMGPRRGAVPAVVPAEQVIARTDDVAIALSCFWVYPTGFEFEVFVDLTDEWSELDPFLFSRRSKRGDVDQPSEGLLLGFEFADGAKVTNVDRGSGWVDAGESKSPVLTNRSGSREGRHARSPFWLWPLPPRGNLEIVCEWSEAGIPLTRCELDSDAIVEAASRAQTIFANSGEAPE